MSHSCKLWIVEVDEGLAEAEHPPFAETLNVLAADISWVLVEADTMGEVERVCQGYLWRVKGYPKAGKYTDLGGQEVYIDDSGNVVVDALEVLKSLDVEIDDYAELYADDILANQNRVW